MRNWVTRRRTLGLLAGAAGLATAVPAVADTGHAPSTSGQTVTASVSRGPTLTAGAVTRTFSYIAGPRSSTATVVNIDNLLINARCDSAGEPVIFAFNNRGPDADLFGRIFDGAGRVNILRQSAFTKANKGVQLSFSSGDYDASGTIGFENTARKVVTVNLIFDNSTTLNHQRVCTVYGSYIAT